ncbi:nucleosome-remodeling factor subunit NURF301 [Lepeophtheirus salmonis]|uniref:nucleosome-remodeling factor subunit NURF301 n=1 Tax=Lepeophtheirus salmonis TaxID=72036 RepID=UPI001AEB3351|nr:nucleosome-remodeling factor subunit NURF301-like [Lepeophtheirus salmonis]
MNTSAAAARRSSRRSRSKTLRALESDAQQQQSRSETPRGSRKSSRASSPAPTRSRKKKKKGGKSSGGSSCKSSNTPSSSGGSGRGYNPNLVNYKDSEYHYGSDFEDEDDGAFDEDQDGDEDDPDSRMDSDESDMLSSICSTEECDVEINPEDPVFIPPDTLPLWLAQDEEAPQLHLPDSSEDLALPPEGLLDVVAIYEILIHYRLLLRLSPFLLEDFCWAMNSDEQSNLLSEIHIALLKALLRADEKEGSTYGPVDQKDSFQCTFYFVDSVTWPENLKAFLSSNDIPPFREAVELMKENEYPFGEDYTKVRIRVLSILCNQFLATLAVREYITSEGTPSIEDHCRVCHRLGDMVVCDTCGGTYHLTCLNPPLTDVPDEEEWTCQICKDNYIKGVTDCYSKGEESSKIRHEVLGYDRRGNKYWFISRRIFIEHKPEEDDDNNEPKVSYFSFKSQFEEVMYALDPDVYETELCATIENMRPEIERQILMTEELTQENKDSSRKTYLEIENEAIKKVQDQRSEAETKRFEEEKRVQEEMRSGNDHEDEIIEKDEGEKIKEKDSDRSDEETEIKDEDLSCNNDIDIKDEINIDSKETITDDLKEEDEIKKETNEISTPSKEKVDEKLAEELRLTRQSVLQLNAGTFYYKLGQEGNYRNYVNSYTTNALAISKVQANEERDKKRYISHKFSLTDASVFKWQGNLFGTRKLLMSTVRQTLIHLENSIPSMFMHANWSILRKPWIGAVNQSVTSRDFSRALTVLQCCMRPCIMLNVWRDQLGHINLKRITAGMREEKKKMEKREKRESDDRDERLKPYMTFVKYTLGVKHLIVKQKGEEYRSHGQHGWLWLSSVRNFNPTDSRTLGLRAGPYRLAVKYTDTRDGSSKVVLMEPRAFEYLLKRQAEIEAKKNSMSSEEEESKSSDNSKIAIEKKKLEEALRNARLDRQIPPEDALVDVVDVENGLSNPTRVLFPKVAKKAHVIDDFLARRLQLKTIEEQCLTEKKNESDEVNDSESVESINDNPHNQKYEEVLSKVKKDIWIIINKLKEDAKSSFQKFNCFSPTCRNYKSFTLSLTPCYSTNCPSRRSPLKEARAFYISVINKAPQEYGITVSESLFYQSFTSHNMALQAFMNLLKSLMQKPRNIKSGGSSLQNGSVKSELCGTPESTANDSSAANKRCNSTFSDLTKLDTEKEESDRIYSSKKTYKKIYLKRVKNSSSDKKSSKIVKYPVAPHFFSKSRKSRSILILSRHDSKHLARKAGAINAEGFNYSAKVNNSFWPYPCPRPTFRTSWLYRTASLSSIHAIALQMRILWGCIRWDDMFAKPLTAEGKHQVTTDTSIITTEILKQRCSGRHLEKNEFLVRKVIIPLDAPKTVVEVIPIRSGLRKRKRAESPQQSEPKVEEEWSDESLLELWEIRAFREKIEKEKAMNTVTRSRTGTAIREPVKYDPGLSNDYPRRERNVKNNENEQPQPGTPQQTNIKTNRETIQQSSQSKKLLGTQVNSSVRPCTPTIIRRVTNPDGTISLVKSTPTMKSIDSPSPTLNTQSLNRAPSTIAPTTKKVFISKDGKIIGTQVVPLGGTGKSTVSTPTVPSKPTVTTTASSTPTQQKVQIVRSSDGKIQVKGLLPGQQLVQMPDGKLQIFSQPNSSTTSTLNSTSNSTISNSQTYSNTKPAGYEMKNTNSSTIDSPGKQQIVAQQLPPGSQIPPGMTVFMSNGKTYCIPKAATLAAQQHQQQQQQQQSQTQSPTITIKKPSLQISPATNKVQATSPQAQIQQQQQQQQQSPNQKSQTVSVMSLGSNTVTFRGNQMIVSGPDQAQAQLIAKHLSSGTARLGNIGGKQVLIMAPNSQAEEQQQSPQMSNITSILPQNPISPSQIQPNISDTGSILANTLSSPLKQDVPSDVQLPKEAANTSSEPQISSPAQVTAQLIQTPQGPRIILQGIQGANLSREQLQSIQQQVKTQLLKAQAEAKLQNRVPPTKIAVVLPPSIQSRIDQQHRLRQEAEQLKRDQSMASSPPPTVVNQEPPIYETPKQPSSSPSVSHQQQQEEQNLVSPLPHKVVQAAQRPTAVHQTTSGQRMLVVTQSGQKILGVANPNIISHEETRGDTSEISNSSKGAPSDASKFEVTQEYIQQTIQNALTDQDLEPEIEQKLLAFQESQNSEDIKDSNIESTSGEPMEDEWQPNAWEEKQASKIDIAHEQPQHNIEIDSCISEETTITTQEEEPAHISPPKINTSISTPHRPRSVSSSSVRRLDEKRRHHIENKISSMLFRQKEQLKKDIAKKRALQEKELQFVIQKEIDKVKTNLSDLNRKDTSSSFKRKKEDESTSPSNRKKKKSGSSSSVPPAAAIQAGIIKKDKVYCICKTKYDATKFYVGCDTCNNWFHGNCVGITEEMSKTMTEYFCDECKSAKDNQEIYCLCRQPYDDLQFYIGCERCADWFHGRCVGILQVEADNIDEYICPRCDSNTSYNYANLKPLNESDNELVKKLVKQLISNRNSWPFKEPVDPNDVPNYYTVVKEPMDLQTIELRVNQSQYQRLSDFVGDVMRIFENCRYFNQDNSQVLRCAESLENYFAQKLAHVREKVAPS